MVYLYENVCVCVCVCACVSWCVCVRVFNRCKKMKKRDQRQALWALLIFQQFLTTDRWEHTHAHTHTHAESVQHTVREILFGIHNLTNQTRIHSLKCNRHYGVATISKLLENIGLFCRALLQKKLICFGSLQFITTPHSSRASIFSFLQTKAIFPLEFLCFS